MFLLVWSAVVAASPSYPTLGAALGDGVRQEDAVCFVITSIFSMQLLRSCC